ncbi:cardioactive peptide-like [Anastrepha ludens]|uniref:cardioactive peptide-like n=1 Tax=Anastrepha ludens TaxID=28586 RepID=UPI0023B1A6B9|nr:cardioactive peptide-like [Anastrepha ludens]
MCSSNNNWNAVKAHAAKLMQYLGYADKRKKCNAFKRKCSTVYLFFILFLSCCKKRSSLPPYPLWKRAEMDEAKTYNNEEMSEGLSDLIDINAEPAVENVQKQIMSQAKIFEAIKEASKEIFRQKNKQKMRQREEVQDNTEGV